MCLPDRGGTFLLVDLSSIESERPDGVGLLPYYHSRIACRGIPAHIFLTAEYHGMSGKAQVHFRRYSYVW